MVGHHHLHTVRNFDFRHRNPLVHNPLDLLHQCRNIQCHAVSDDARCVIIEYPGWQSMQCKFAVIIYNRMTCIGSALESYDNISFFPQHIGDLAFSLVTPVCSNDSFNHIRSLLNHFHSSYFNHYISAANNRYLIEYTTFFFISKTYISLN